MHKHLLLILLLFVIVSTGLSQPQEAADLLKKGIALRLERKFQEAYLALSTADSLMTVSATRNDSLRAHIQYEKGLMEYNLGNPTSAYATLSSAAVGYDTLHRFGELADCYLYMSNAAWEYSAEQAMEDIDKAISAVQKDVRGTRRYRGRYLAEKGYLVAYMLNLSDALELIQEGLRLDSAYFGKNHLKTSETLMLAGSVYNLYEDFYAAIHTFQRIEAIYNLQEVPVNELDLGILYGNMGVSYFNVGQFDKAEYYQLRVKNIFERKLRKEHPNRQLVALALGEIYHNMGKSYLSYQMYQEARQNNVSNNPSVDLMTLIGEAFWWQNQKDYKRGTACLLAADSLYVSTYGNETKNYGNILENIGQLAMLEKNIDMSRQYYHRAQAIYATQTYPTHPSVAAIDGRLAELYYNNQLLDSAAYYADEGLRKIWQDHKDFELIKTPQLFFQLLDYKARILARQNRSSFTKEAIYWCKLSMDYADFLRSIYRDNDEMNLSASNRITIDLLMDTYWQYRQNEPDLEQQLFALAEAGKFNQLYAATIKTSIPALDKYLTENKLLHEELNFYRQKLTDYQSTADDSGAIAEWNGNIFQINRQIDALKDNMNEQVSLLLPTISKQKPSYKVVQQALQRESAFLSYAVTDAYIYIQLITKDTIVTKAIAQGSSLDSLVSVVYAYCRSPRNLRPKGYIQAASQLYDILLKPVEELLPRHLTIIPDQALSSLPFEVLLIHTPNHFDLRTMPYLLTRHTVSYAYSAAMFLELNAEPATLPSQPGILAVAPLSEDASIRYSGLEVAHLQREYGATVLMGQAANASNFKQLAPAYTILHIATHASANTQDGDLSYLAFSDDEAGKIYARDIYALTLKANIVVLSACETLYGEYKKGEGVISLARAFTFAGCKSIVASLWTIEDAATHDIIQKFYSYLLKHNYSKADALHQAKLDYLTSHFEEKAHPAYWAGIIVVGDAVSPL